MNVPEFCWRPLRSFRSTNISFAVRASVAITMLGCTLIGAPRPAHADKWALLIGIDQYADSNRISSLGGAAADARALAKTLHEAAGLPDNHIQLLVSDGDPTARPTRVEILNALTRLAANAKAGDTVFVLYSGHGIEIDGTSYLLPYDTSALSNTDIVDSAIETGKFTKRLRLIKARALVLAFDMCRSDPRKGSRAIGGNTDNKFSSAFVRGLDFAAVTSSRGAPIASVSGPSIAITFYSCSPNERSYEDPMQARGYFSEYLEKGLRGAAADASGMVRVATLAKYLQKNVHTAVSQAENGASQTPYPEINGPDAGEFALARRTTLAVPALNGKVVLRYRARIDQTENIRGTLSLIVAGDGGRFNLSEVDKITFVNVDPKGGDISTESKAEGMTMSSSSGIRNTDAPEASSLTIRPDGTLVAIKAIEGNSAGDGTVARLRQAIGIVFAERPVGSGDKWTHDYVANAAMGTPAAHGDYEILSATTIDGATQFKIKMSYAESGAAPIVSRGTYLVDPETGDCISSDVEISGLVVAGLVTSGTLHSERFEEGASR